MDKVVLVVITVDLLLLARDTVKDHHRKGLGDLLLVQDMVKDRRLLVRDMVEDMEDIIMDHHLVNAAGSEITARHNRVVMVVEDITEEDMGAVEVDTEEDTEVVGDMVGEVMEEVMANNRPRPSLLKRRRRAVWGRVVCSLLGVLVLLEAHLLRMLLAIITKTCIKKDTKKVSNADSLCISCFLYSI